jgi:predicted GTPase
MENALHSEETSQDEPLRILVAGQTKAGKSSLINALFGELRAPVDALPSTYALSPYRLEQEGEFLGLVFDSPGYGDHASWVEDSRAELQMIDLILLACSATHAGRAADSRFLEALRTQFANTPDRLPPPVIVAVTHIDLLRPAREWNPPYNIDQPSGFKETQIRLCMEEIATTLVIPLEQVQAVCLQAGGAWNIEAVWTAIAAQLPQARRARYLRCLKDGKAREKWELILRQLRNAGRLVVGGIGKGLTG